MYTQIKELGQKTDCYGGTHRLQEVMLGHQQLEIELSHDLQLLVPRAARGTNKVVRAEAAANFSQ